MWLMLFVLYTQWKCSHPFCSHNHMAPVLVCCHHFDLLFDLSENTQEVTLTKSGGGLGFSFLMCELDPPTRDFGTLVRIKKLFPGQPAQQSRRILEGDVLLAINGQSLKKLTYLVRPHFRSHKNEFAYVTDLYMWTSKNHVCALALRDFCILANEIV